jgi:hypothetical protein
MLLVYQILQNTFQNEYLLSVECNHYKQHKQPWRRLQSNTKLQPNISAFNKQTGITVSLWTYRYLQSTQFQPRPEHRPPRPLFFIVLLSPPKKMPVQYNANATTTSFHSSFTSHSTINAIQPEIITKSQNTA